MSNEFYRLTVNGMQHEVRDAWAGESLLYVLRERLGLPGTKGACEQGECGSCTVLMDGEAVCSCLVMAATAVDADITTVEGLSVDGEPTDVLVDQRIRFTLTDALRLENEAVRR